MALKTPKLGLILPALGEFFNRWNKPVNENFTKIDDILGATVDELAEARGTALTINDRISGALNEDGSLKEVPEVAKARSSKIYGSAIGAADYDLDDRLEQGDLESWSARAGLASVADSVAYASDLVVPDSLITGPTNPLTFTGAVASINGLTTPIVANINGYRTVVDTKQDTTLSGPAGTYYLYLDRAPNGVTYFSIPASAGSTALYAPTGKLSKFVASATNFVSQGVKPGHVLNITAPSANLNIGRWIVEATALEDSVNLQPNELRIVGEFRAALTNLSAEVIDQYRPIFGATLTAHSKVYAREAGRVFVGRCVFDGTNITSLTTYAYRGQFSQWQSITPTLGNFEISVPHNLGFVPKNIKLYASQANDFSQPLEPIEAGKMSTGTVSLSAGDQTVSYTAPKLNKNVIVRFTDITVDIKNATNGIFYEDYAGNAQTTGFLYVVVER